MKDLEIQEQAEKMYPSPNHPTGYAFKTSEVVEMERKSFIEGAKWMQERDKWISLPSDTSKIPTGFLLAYGLNEHGKERRIRAYYAQPFTDICDIEINDDNYDYSEENDEFYLKEGWYECNDCEEINWRVTYPITHFMPLPQPPKTK